MIPDPGAAERSSSGRGAVSFFPYVDLGDAFQPFLALRQGLGFLPDLFRAQTLLPRAIESEARVAGALLLKTASLTRIQKESILVAISAAHENIYCVTAHVHLLETLGMPDERIDQVATDYRAAGLPAGDVALLDFACKLSGRPTSISRADFDALRRHGFADGPILEAVLITALTEFLCTLSTGLGAEPDFQPRDVRPARRWWLGTAAGTGPGVGGHDTPGPFLRAIDMPAGSFPPFAFFRDRFGFVPNIFRAQTLRPDIVEAEAHMVGTVLLTEDVLSRTRKEYILLVVSAANLNTYCVAVHCEMLRALGVPEEISDQIAVDHRRAALPEADGALLDCALKLARRPREFSKADIEALRRHGFSETQILEAVIMTSLTNFLNTLQMGLGTIPDFPPKRVVSGGTTDRPRPASARGDGEGDTRSLPGDDDTHLVEQVRRGDITAFENLVRRHHRRVYRTLMGITGNHEEAEDGVQNTFLKAFEHIGRFEGASRFSTWLTRIAINEGVQRLRQRRDTESLDAPTVVGADEEEPFRPGDLQAWTEDPEQLYSRAEIRARVEKELMGLPAEYRLAVILRDIERLSIDEAAAAMGLGGPTFKTRLSRARLMLREALAPHFARGGGSHARD